MIVCKLCKNNPPIRGIYGLCAYCLDALNHITRARENIDQFNYHEALRQLKLAELKLDIAVNGEQKPNDESTDDSNAQDTGEQTN